MALSEDQKTLFTTGINLTESSEEFVSAHDVANGYKLIEKNLFEISANGPFKPSCLTKFPKKDILFIAGEKRMIIMNYTQGKFEKLRNFEEFHSSNHFLTLRWDIDNIPEIVHGTRFQRKI
jgi:hypothetical protein